MTFRKILPFLPGSWIRILIAEKRWIGIRIIHIKRTGMRIRNIGSNKYR